MVIAPSHPVVRRSRAFTLIELLVVIAIIGILIGLVLVVAKKVSGSGKQRVTEQTLRFLDAALTNYISATGGNPPPTVPHPWEKNRNVLIPVADARNCTFVDTGVASGEENRPINNSVGLFMLQCESVPEAAAAFRDIDTKMVRSYDPLTATGRASAAAPTSPLSFTGSGNPPTPLTVVPPLTTAMDGWGNPIRYVHPTFKGNIVENPTANATAMERKVTLVLGPAPTGKTYSFDLIRRADGSFTFTPQAPNDADGGMPLSNRPYFYSCGPDGDPTTTDDNVYLTRPKFVKK